MMILYSKTTNSTIWIEKTKGSINIHVREWNGDQPIKDARINIDYDENEAFIEILEKCRP